LSVREGASSKCLASVNAVSVQKMSLVSDCGAKLSIACDRGRSGIVRAFAVAELICLPVSIATVVAVVSFAILRRSGIWTPPAAVLTWVIPILVSAAVGYLTNYVAITMLFEPYERTWRHWLPWCTFGIWRQGLIPKNKARIAAVLAEQVATKLIRPEKLADDLCSMAGSALQDPDVLRAAQKLLQEQVAAHDSEIIEFLVPRIENALVGEIERLVTPERVTSFWNEEIMPRLESEETREEITRIVLAALRKRAPNIAAKAKPAIVRAVRRYVEEKFDGSILKDIPFLGERVAESMSLFFASSADAIADWILDEKTIEDALTDWIRRPETGIEVRDELAGFVSSVRDWLASPEGAARIGGFAGDIRAKFKEYLREYLKANLAPAAMRILNSETTWEWVSNAIPAVRPGIERMIREIGTKSIIEKLNVEGRVKTAVNGMDMAEFHEMLNQVMAEHLGAIQVLGYLLGAFAGLLLVFS